MVIMENSWQQSLDELNRYIHNHPEIRIENHMVAIPEENKPEFYVLFQQIQKSMIRSDFANLLSAAKELSASYLNIERKVSLTHYNARDKNYIRLTKKDQKNKHLRLA
jgi:hypothetical protein